MIKVGSLKHEHRSMAMYQLQPFINQHIVTQKKIGVIDLSSVNLAASIEYWSRLVGKPLDNYYTFEKDPNILLNIEDRKRMIQKYSGLSGRMAKHVIINPTKPKTGAPAEKRVMDVFESIESRLQPVSIFNLDMCTTVNPQTVANIAALVNRHGTDYFLLSITACLRVAGGSKRQQLLLDEFVTSNIGLRYYNIEVLDQYGPVSYRGNADGYLSDELTSKGAPMHYVVMACTKKGIKPVASTKYNRTKETMELPKRLPYLPPKRGFKLGTTDKNRILLSWIKANPYFQTSHIASLLGYKLPGQANKVKDALYLLEKMEYVEGTSSRGLYNRNMERAKAGGWTGGYQVRHYTLTKAGHDYLANNVM